MNVFIVHKHVTLVHDRAKTKICSTVPHAPLDLLLLQDGEKSHYVWIKKMSRLIAIQSKHESEAFVCPHCVHPFTTRVAFRRHFLDCSKHERQHLKFPDEKHEKLFWKAHAKTQMYPFVIYADFESCLIPVNNEQVAGTTHAVTEHIPFGFCAYTVCKFKEKKMQIFRGMPPSPFYIWVPML